MTMLKTIAASDKGKGPIFRGREVMEEGLAATTAHLLGRMQGDARFRRADGPTLFGTAKLLAALAHARAGFEKGRTPEQIADEELSRLERQD